MGPVRSGCVLSRTLARVPYRRLWLVRSSKAVTWARPRGTTVMLDVVSPVGPLLRCPKRALR
jgi:hypothetical protein